MKADRLEKVLKNMHELALDRLIVSSPTSIYYLTGKMIHPGERLVALNIGKSGDVSLIANRLFAVGSVDGAKLIEYDDTDNCEQILSDTIKGGKLGVDKDWPCRFALPLIGMRTDLQVSVGSAAVDKARMLKTPEEIIFMRESSRLNDKAINQAISALRDGVKESEIAKVYTSAASSLGAGGGSFDSLICFGANCAEPHHDTDDTVIREGDSVILDVGAKKDGYCSDMTRTVFFKTATEEQKFVYSLVEEANAAGRAAVKPGVKLKDVDRAARSVIESAGYGDFFIHRTGHGIGLEVHEYPDVSSVSETVCEPGMVFSVEPGVYLKGRFGVRVEDLVCVTEDGCETFNQYTKEMRIIGC